MSRTMGKPRYEVLHHVPVRAERLCVQSCQCRPLHVTVADPDQSFAALGETPQAQRRQAHAGSTQRPRSLYAVSRYTDAAPSTGRARSIRAALTPRSAVPVKADIQRDFTEGVAHAAPHARA